MSASAQDVLGIARDVVAHPEMGMNGVWPRAAAHLCRQALELALEEFWKKRMPALADATLRAQLVCLPLYMKDEELARSVGYTWSALSHACHHHMYELAPAVSELKAWADTVEALIRE
jgi:hypothetical protein